MVLRPVGAADEEEFLALARASTGLHHPWLYLPTTPDEFAGYLARFDGETACGFVVCLRETGGIVGMVNIGHIVRGSYQRGVLGFGAFTGGTGRGYLSEGLALALAYGFGPLGLHRLEADIQPANGPALALVGRLGFRREGCSPGFIRIEGAWRDHERWAITADMPVRTGAP